MVDQRSWWLTRGVDTRGDEPEEMVVEPEEMNQRRWWLTRGDEPEVMVVDQRSWWLNRGAGG